MKSGFVSIVGRPNTGKSTLINTLINQKIAIVSNVAGTTRNTIQGIYNDDDSQIVFVDTPGIHKPLNKLGKFLNKEAESLTKDVDAILFLVDAYEGIGSGDKRIIESLKGTNSPVILVINKIDRISKDKLIDTINEYKDLYDFVDIYPLSALKDNLKDLLKTIKKYLPNEGKIFEDDTVTNISTDFYISEIIREKVLRKTREEVPHGVTCVVEEREENKNRVVISAVIIVEKESHKRIIVGSHGSMLKAIGTDARCDLEEYFGKTVYLNLFVKVIENWKEKDRYLKELGIDDLDNFE